MPKVWINSNSKPCSETSGSGQNYLALTSCGRRFHTNPPLPLPFPPPSYPAAGACRRRRRQRGRGGRLEEEQQQQQQEEDGVHLVRREGALRLHLPPLRLPRVSTRRTIRSLSLLVAGWPASFCSSLISSSIRSCPFRLDWLVGLKKSFEARSVRSWIFDVTDLREWVGVVD